jgi:hypothetical protein
MNRLVLALVGPALALCAVAQAAAEMVTIDFEAFADRANLYGVNLGGVTLTNPSGKVEIFDDRFGVYYHSATKAIASSSGCSSVNPLVGVFDKPVCYVSLWGGDAGTSPETDSWELLAFDAPVGGNLLGSVASGTWIGNPYRQLSITASGILRFEAYWTGTEMGIGYDDLQFSICSPEVPEPATILLAASGLLCLPAYLWRRRRAA